MPNVKWFSIEEHLMIRSQTGTTDSSWYIVEMVFLTLV
jgi:hypothetical protein